MSFGAEMKDKQITKYNTLSNIIAKSSLCASRINIESHLHAHEFYEFSICLQGEFENEYNLETSFLMNKGMVFFARPNEVHKINRKNNGDFLRDDVYVESDKMAKICASLSDDLLGRINALQGPIIFSLDFDTLNNISKKIQYLSDVSSRSSNAGVEHNFMVVQLINLVYDKFVCKKEITMPKWLMQVRNKISRPENFMLPISDLLENSFYSRTYISVAFKKYMGETIVEFRNRLKVKYSLSMLAENAMSISVIAGLLGWDNPNNYIIAFKKVYGLTPLQYRNLRLKN